MWHFVQSRACEEAVVVAERKPLPHGRGSDKAIQECVALNRQGGEHRENVFLLTV